MSYKSLFFLLFLLVALFHESISHARSIDPLLGLEALRKGFVDTTDFTAEITQEKQFSIMKRTMTTTGVVRFKKPDIFFMEIKPPYSSRLLLRDNTIEQSNGKDNNKNRIILPPEQSLKQWFSKLTTPFTKIPDGVDLRADLTASNYTLYISPFKKGMVKELAITFQADGIIRKVVINEQNGDKTTMTFRKFKKNIGLSESDLSL